MEELSFCWTINDLRSTSRIHKIFSREPKQDPGLIKVFDGFYTASRKETLELLASHHFSDGLILTGDDRPSEWVRKSRSFPED